MDALLEQLRAASLAVHASIDPTHMTGWMPTGQLVVYYEQFMAFASANHEIRSRKATNEMRLQLFTKLIRSMEGAAFMAPGHLVSEKLLGLHPEMVTAVRGKHNKGTLIKAIGALIGDQLSKTGKRGWSKDDLCPMLIEHPVSVAGIRDQVLTIMSKRFMPFAEFASLILEGRPVLIHKIENKDLTKSRFTLAEAMVEYRDQGINLKCVD